MAKFKFSHRSQKPIAQHVQEHGIYSTNSRAKEKPTLALHQNGHAIPESSDRFINPSKGNRGRGRGWHWMPPIAGAKKFVVQTVSRAGLHEPIERREEEFEQNEDQRLQNIIDDYEATIARYGQIPQS